MRIPPIQIKGMGFALPPTDANWNPFCDISDPHDGIIDELDLAVFTNNWLTGP